MKGQGSGPNERIKLKEAFDIYYELLGLPHTTLDEIKKIQSLAIEQNNESTRDVYLSDYYLVAHKDGSEWYVDAESFNKAIESLRSKGIFPQLDKK